MIVINKNKNMKKLIIIAFIVFSASMSKLYSQEISIINLPLNSYDTIKKYYYIPNIKKTCDTIVYDFNFVKDTCINKDLFIECEGKRMELEAKCLVAYHNYNIEKHNRKQSDRFAIFSWLVTGFTLINTIIYINNK